MRHWLQLATRNWRTRPARSALAVLAIALGVGVVVWVTCCYESVRVSVTKAVLDWIGRSHAMVEPSAGVWGCFSEDLAERIADVPGIEKLTMRTREYVDAAPPPSGLAGGDEDLASSADFVRIEITGILPERELDFFSYKLAAGRFLRPDDRGAVLVEQLLAQEFKLAVGDTILLRHHSPPQPVQRFTIVGVVDRRRASANQAMMTWGNLPDVQSLCKLPRMVKSIDIQAFDPSPANIGRIAGEIQAIIEAYNRELKERGADKESTIVKTTEAQHQKLGAAQGLLQFIMLLLSCVVLMTAFFIIIATMGMGVTEQVTQLGLLRCVGVTRGQLGTLVLLQTVPLGVLGTLLGVPLGLLLYGVTVRLSPEYLGEMAVSRFGIGLAVLGGLGTTLLGAAIPAAGAFFVSPVEAVRAQVGRTWSRWFWLLAVLGAGLIGAHELLKRSMTRDGAVGFDAQAVAGLLLLYSGAALLAPAVVIVVGRAVVIVTASLLRLRPQLLGDEIAKAPFRAASICCGLMVALSLIVGLIVWGRSVKQGWEFPKEFPDALLYSYLPIPLETVLALRDTPGTIQFTAIDDFPFYLKRPPKSGLLRTFADLETFSRFMAIDPDTGLAIAKLTFIEGDEREAVAKLKQGGHLLITREFSKANSKHVGDKVTVWVEKKRDEFKRATFTVAGVVASPGVDIAISFFNASTYFQSYAVGAIIGTLDDAQKHFGRSYGKLILFNFDTAKSDASRVHSSANQAVVLETQTTPGGRPTFAAGPGPIPGDGPEERIVNGMLEKLDWPPKAFVTARELKQQIDSSIDRVTLLLSAIPAVGLVIAALGVANLMAAGVAARSRQTAVLRALGVTKGQMARMVIGEGLVLGLLGSVMGLALGVYLGRTSNFLTELLSGFHPDFAVPWSKVCLGAALATGLCLLAALVPARYASRSNIVAALSE